MYKIALVEDDELIRTMVKLNLEKEGYQVTCCQDAESLLNLVDGQVFDLILLDIMLPGISGEELLQNLRNSDINTPVIMVTAKNDVDSKVRTLAEGADDYIAKPFHVEELLARISAVIRRSQGERVLPSDRTIKIGQFEVNLDTRNAASNEGIVRLSEKETRLLSFFYQHAGETLSRPDILDEVWGKDNYPTTRTIDNFILKFRKLFEEYPDNPKHFFTVFSTGYMFQP